MLLFVTNAGIELYSLAKDKLKHVKTAAYNVVYHWVLLEANLLLLVDAKSVFAIYQLSSKTIVKLSKFELDCANTSAVPPKNGHDFHREQITLTTLYGRMVIAFVNEAKAQLHLLSLTPNTDEMEQTHVFDLIAVGKHDVSVIDNLLVLHHAQSKQSVIFDIRTDGKAAIAPPHAIGSPIEASSMTYYDPLNEHVEEQLPDDFHPYHKWTFLSPYFVWESIGDQQQGHFWTLAINYQSIALGWDTKKKAKLVDFLMRRNHPAAKMIVLQIILQVICTEPTQLPLMSRLFSMINRINYDHKAHLQQTQQIATDKPNHKESANSLVSPRSATANTSGSTSAASSTASKTGLPRSLSGLAIDDYESSSVLDCDKVDFSQYSFATMTCESNINGYMLIQQMDLFVYVFARARQVIPATLLTPPLVEYLRSIYRHYLKIEDVLNDLLVSLLLMDHKYYEFHQYLQYHIFNDSLPIANKLIEISSIYPAAYQLGLDMLDRLGAKRRLCRVLLQHHQVTAALKLVTPTRDPLFDQPGLKPKDWLRVAYETGDIVAFYCVVEFFKQRNVAVRSTHQFYVTDGCNEYIAHYERLFVPSNLHSPPLQELPPPQARQPNTPVFLQNVPATVTEGPTKNPFSRGPLSQLTADQVRVLYQYTYGDDDDDDLEEDELERIEAEEMKAAAASAPSSTIKSSESSSSAAAALSPAVDDDDEDDDGGTLGTGHVMPLPTVADGRAVSSAEHVVSDADVLASGWVVQDRIDTNGDLQSSPTYDLDPRMTSDPAAMDSAAVKVVPRTSPARRPEQTAIV